MRVFLQMKQILNEKVCNVVIYQVSIISLHFWSKTEDMRFP